MKKLLLVIPVIALLAAACNTTQTEINNSNSQIQSNTNWKTYTNAKVGYSVKYPADWHAIESGGNDVGFDPATTKNEECFGIGVSCPAIVISSQNGMSIDEYTKNTSTLSFSNKLQVTINGNKFTKVTRTDPGNNSLTFYLLQKGDANSQTVVELWAADPQYNNIVEEMIKTFKLTN